MQNLWKQFPRLLVERINGLLEEAEPGPQKTYQLYKSCQSENLWTGDFDQFAKRLSSFFSLPKVERKKSRFDQYLDRPMDQFLFQEFNLTFRHAVVPNNAIHEVASWAHNLMRISLRVQYAVISTQVLSQTIKDLTEPAPHEKDLDFDFEDFCFSLKKICFHFFGKNKDSELNHIIKELNWLNHQLKSESETALETDVRHPGIYLTQTEIDWTEQVQMAVLDNVLIPRFPLSRGLQKQKLVDLDRAATLYNLVHTTQLPELMQQKVRIRNTLLEICDWLLKEKAS